MDGVDGSLIIFNFYCLGYYNTKQDIDGTYITMLTTKEDNITPTLSTLSYDLILKGEDLFSLCIYQLVWFLGEERSLERSIYSKF